MSLLTSLIHALAGRSVPLLLDRRELHAPSRHHHAGGVPLQRDAMALPMQVAASAQRFRTDV